VAMQTATASRPWCLSDAYHSGHRALVIVEWCEFGEAGHTRCISIAVNYARRLDKRSVWQNTALNLVHTPLHRTTEVSMCISSLQDDLTVLIQTSNLHAAGLTII
jgi:hypothetical protein